MTLHIRRNAQLGFIAALICGSLAFLPATVRADPPVNGFLIGNFAVSPSAGTFTGTGSSHPSYVGRATFDLDLVMTPVPGEPLCRGVAGDLIFTTPSGDELFVHVASPDEVGTPGIGTICLDPNSGIILGIEIPAEVRGGTGRFATASGRGFFGILGQLDDSGAAGSLTIHIDLDITR